MSNHERSSNTTTAPLHEIRRSVKLMGNNFSFTVVAQDAAWANGKIDMAIAEIKRIEDLLTTFSETSETFRINQQAGIKPVVVTPEVFKLIERSLRISSVTDGAFDITYGSLDKSMWNFDRDMKRLPDVATARQMVRLINYRNVKLNRDATSVYLLHHGMRIGFGGIGKGYAADMAKSLLIKEGVSDGIVNASDRKSTR